MSTDRKHGIFGPSNLDEPEEKGRAGRPLLPGNYTSVVHLSGETRNLLVSLANGHGLSLKDTITRLVRAVGDPKFCKLAGKYEAERLMLLEVILEGAVKEAGIE